MRTESPFPRAKKEWGSCAADALRDAGEKKVLTIRNAFRSEHRSLEDLQRRSSLEGEEYRERLAAHPDAIQLPLEQIRDDQVFVAEQNGHIVGFAVVLRGAGGAAELDGLFVDPPARRTGIGSRLIREAERRAVAFGATTLQVVANPAAEPFYLACGFAFAGTRETRFGPARTMQKTLPGGTS